MVKPRAKITRSTTPKRDYIFFIEPEIEIAAWCPDPGAQKPAEQVHLIMHLPSADDLPPLILRFKSPDTLGFLIEELARYRRAVWPDAEPVAWSEFDDGS